MTTVMNNTNKTWNAVQPCMRGYILVSANIPAQGFAALASSRDVLDSLRAS